ncbi:MAG: DUF1697 domain-containing protein [Candidatus Nomurabacteria bacterium]|nr:MAG: DUF1697 domain-containing protein [Candidatus Nomurabacteria bacterium]
MQYIALLRGINVGGNSKVEMPKLKILFEDLGFTDVKTYINSGNVIFSSSQNDIKKICLSIEQGIKKEFKFSVPVLVITEAKLKKIVSEIPEAWQNNSEMKCDVMFLWDEVDSPETLELLNLDKDLEDFKYVPGAIIWRIDRDKVTKSKVLKMIGTDIYKKMTVRNCNTVRKIIS